MANTMLRRYKVTCPLSVVDGTYNFNDSKVDVNLGKYWRILPASTWGSLPVYVSLGGTEWQVIDSSWQINPFGQNPTTLSVRANKYLLSATVGFPLLPFTTDSYISTEQSYWVETTDEMPPPGANPPRNRCEKLAAGVAVDGYFWGVSTSLGFNVPAWARKIFRIQVQSLSNGSPGYCGIADPNWKTSAWSIVYGNPNFYTYGSAWWTDQQVFDILPSQYRPAIDNPTTGWNATEQYAGVFLRLDMPSGAKSTYTVWVSE